MIAKKETTEYYFSLSKIFHLNRGKKKETLIEF